MVIRIFRDGICRPSKFPKPKFNALHIKRSTTSQQPPDEVARCKEYQRVDPTLGSQRFDDPTISNITRPTLCIAHTTVFDAGKDDNANTETLLENLQKRLAAQTGLKRNLAVHKEQKNETSEDTAGTNRQGEDHKDDLQAGVLHYATTNDGNTNNDDKLLQRPERIEERDETKTIDPPNLKPSHIGYRFEANTQLDELAKKYLNMQKDLIDNRLSQDMERFGLPIDPREAMRPSVNVNVSCEEDTNVEMDVTKPEKPQQKEVINSNPEYCEISWCNLYFKPPKENESEITFERDSIDTIDTSKGYIQCTRSEEMLPLNCCIDFDSLDKSCEKSISAEKLGFEKHDDIIPLHQLQCMDITDLNLRVKSDKIESPIENLYVEEGLPNHLYLQGHLTDDVATAPNTIPTIGLYDLITSIDETELGENIPKKQVTDVFHSLMTQDTDVTKFDYLFPRDYELPYTLSELPKKSDTIIQIKNQTMPTEREHIGENNPTFTNMNLVRPKVSHTVQTAMNDLRTDNQPTTPYQNSKTDAELIQFINAKVMEQIGAINTLQHTTQRPPQRLDRLVQMNPISPPAQELHNEEVKKLIHTKVLEQMRESHTLKHTSHSIKGLDSIVQIAPREVHKEPLTGINVIKDHGTRQKEEATVKCSKHAPEINVIKDHATSQKEEETVKSSKQAPEINVIKDHATCLKEEATVKSSKQAPEINVIKDHATSQKEEENVKSPNQAPEINEVHATFQKEEAIVNISNLNITKDYATCPNQAQLEPIIEQNTDNVKMIDTAKEEEETIHPSRGTETMVQSCVQAAPTNETQKAVPPNASSIPKTLEDLTNKLTLDLNLSLSELLRRVRARNRLQYLQDIKEQITKMSTFYAEKRCPPSDRPQSPPPPDCTRPCDPPSKPKCPPEPPKCPPDPPKCPPDPPKCPPEPPKCPPKKAPKCPPDPPKCPPKPKPKSPCPCPPPPKCPPPKRPCCTATTLDDPVIILDAATIYLGSFIKRIRTGFLLSRHTSLPSINITDGSLEDARLNLNRIRDFEPWTPIPSWPFPVDPKKILNQDVKRSFCKTELAKPKHEDKRHTDMPSDLPTVVQTTNTSVQYGELWKAYTVENELCAVAKNANIFVTCSLWDLQNTDGKQPNKPYDIASAGDSKKHVDAILQTYSELQELSSQNIKKSALDMIEEKASAEPLEATLNATTKDLEEEKLIQKLETIEEVSLVEADPAIIKPPQTSGPVVMNTTSVHNCEEFAKNSDFQVGDDPIDAALAACLQAKQIEQHRNLINSYFETEGQKPNFNDLITLSTVPEINANEELSLTELMQRVRQRNRILRCRDINQQLNATSTDETTMDQGGTSFPQHQNPHVQPGWGWPSQPQNQPFRSPAPSYPHVANPHPQKAEPITPDSRPGYNRASKVNPVTLALYLGPLVAAFRNTALLLPLLIAYLIY